MNSNITPETDANQFRLYPSNKFAVHADFAKKLEIERNQTKKKNKAMHKAICNAWEHLQGVEKHCSVNHGSFIQGAIKILEPFVVQPSPEKVVVDKKEYEALLEDRKWTQALKDVSKDISFPEASEELLWHVYNLAAAVVKAKEDYNNSKL